MFVDRVLDAQVSADVVVIVHGYSEKQESNFYRSTEMPYLGDYCLRTLSFGEVTIGFRIGNLVLW